MRDVGHDRRLEERAAERVALAAEATFAPLARASGDVLLDLGERLGVDQRTLVGRALEAVAHSQLAHRLDELARESVVDRVLHQQPVGAHTGLAGVAILAGDRALHRRIEIRVLEHDEGRVAAELQRQLLQRGGTLRHQLLADLGGAGEREFANDRIGSHLCTDGAGVTGEHVNDTGRHPRSHAELGHGESRERSL